MADEDLTTLERELSQADFSLGNPKIKDLIIRELEEWVESYQYKKTHELYDKYGRHGEIPDVVFAGGQGYSPTEILEQAKSDSTVGNEILEKIYTAWSNLPSYLKLFRINNRRNFVVSLLKEMSDENRELDDKVARGITPTGIISFSTRDIVRAFIDISPDLPLNNLGLPEAIKGLYTPSQIPTPENYLQKQS